MGNIIVKGWAYWEWVTDKTMDVDGPSLPLEKGSPLLDLPSETRRHILKYLSPKCRKAVRITCGLLANEIDDHLGASNSICLHDRRPQEALEFFSRSTWRSIRITSRWMLSFECIFYRPKKLLEMIIWPKGSISSPFGDSILSQCSNLTTMKWYGTIVGILKDEPCQWFTNLEVIIIDLKSTQSIIGPLMPLDEAAPSATMELLQNQISLLRRIRSVKSSIIHLSLKSLRHTKIIHDLTIELFTFLAQHPKLKVLIIEITLIQPRVEPVHEEPPENPQILPAIPIPKALEIEKFLLKTTLEQSEQQWELLPYISKLKFLCICNDMLKWPIIQQTIASNSQTLEELDIRGVINDPIDLQCLSGCPLLTVLKIHNTDFEEFSPNVEHFEPHPNLLENLKTLIITCIQLPQHLLFSLNS